jgi:hydrogenase maturation protease
VNATGAEASVTSLSAPVSNEPVPTSARSTTGRPPVLVIGVGSELRSDDAVGRRVVESVGRRRPPEQLEVRSVHQLTPELADAMTGRELVIVVDAAVGATAATVTEVASVPAAGAMSHHLDVAALVGLARLLGRAPARVVTLGVPAFELGLGTALSAGAAAVVDVAAEVVLSLGDEVLTPAPRHGASGP